MFLDYVINRMTRRHEQLRHHDHDHDNDVKSSQQTLDHPRLNQCLTTFDLVSLGMGSCLGTGMYLTTGIVASAVAGPAAILSLLLAGIGSILSGLCYAELAGLCPRTSGSAYMYTYITVGEFAAFIVGWGLIVEYVIGTAAGAVALSETLNSLTDGAIKYIFQKVAATIGIPKLDLVATCICLILTLILAAGVEMSARMNNVLNVINMLVLAFFLGASLFFGSILNWTTYGFFPFGARGVVRAIPTCYFAYIGFDTVATTGEEAKNPRKAIPIAILLSVVINCLAYMIVLSCLTLDIPYKELSQQTALTDIFTQLKFLPGKYIVSVGAVSGLFAATFGSMFPLPRVLNAMAIDGLVFKCLAKICPKRRIPVRATVVSGAVAMVMATFVNLDLLIELVLIGTLLAYILVTFAMLYMRFIIHREDPDSDQVPDEPVPEPQTRLYESLECESDSVLSPRHKHKPSLQPPPEYKKAVTTSLAKPKTTPNEKTGIWSKCKGNPSDESTQAIVKSSKLEDEATCDYNDSQTTNANSQDHKPYTAAETETRNLSSAVSPKHLLQKENKQWTHSCLLKSNCLMLMADFADSVSQSPRRIFLLLSLVYVVEIILCLTVSLAWSLIADGNSLLMSALALLSAILMVLTGIICLMPQTPESTSFRAPFVPVLPLVISLFNIFLMTNLSGVTWLMFSIWILVGLCVYFLYGIRQNRVEALYAIMNNEAPIEMEDLPNGDKD